MCYEAVCFRKYPGHQISLITHEHLSLCHFFNYILNTFKHFIFLCHNSQLLVHPYSQSTLRRLFKLPFFYSSCPILPRLSVFISSLFSSREKQHPFFPIADTRALVDLLSSLMRLLSSGKGLSPYVMVLLPSSSLSQSRTESVAQRSQQSPNMATEPPALVCTYLLTIP